jgi:hypothetical protein
MSWFDAIKNIFGDKSEKEAEEIIEIANDPEGDDWDDQFPITPRPGTDTPDEIEVVHPPESPDDRDGKGIFGRLFGR